MQSDAQGEFSVYGKQMLLSPHGHPWALWEQGIKQEGKRKINEWKSRAGLGPACPCGVPAATAAFPQPRLSVTCVRRRSSSPLCACPRPERAAPLQNPALRWKDFPPCIMCMKIIRTLCNHSTKSPEIHAACTKGLLCCLVYCVGPRAKCKRHGESRSLNKKNERGVSSHVTSGQGACGSGVHFRDCFFMTWQSYCCRWGQCRGTWGGRAVVWAFVFDCMSVGAPVCMCKVRLVSVFPRCLIQRTKLKGRWKMAAALTNINRS